MLHLQKAVLLAAALALAPVGAAAEGMGALTAAIEAASTPRTLTEALVRRGDALRTEGRFNAAIEDLTRAASVAPTDAAQRYALAALGAAQAEAGQSGAARNLRAAIGPTGVPATAAEVVAAAHLARLQVGQGAVAEARRLAADAVAAAPEGLLRGFALTVAGEAALAAGDSAAAEPAFRGALAELAGLAPGGTRDSALLDLAGAALRAAPASRFVALADRAMDGLSPDLSDRRSAAAEDVRAQIAFAGGRGGEALERSAVALSRAQRIGADDLVFRIANRRAEIARTLGRPEVALGGYRAAFEALGVLRADLALRFDETGQSIYRTSFEDFHTDYIDLLLRQSERGDKQALLTEALNALEDFKVLELEDYFQERCVRVSEEADVGAIDPSTVLVYPVVLADRVEIITGRNGVLDRRASPIAKGDFEPLVQAALAASSDFDQPYEATSKALYDVLIAPIADVLEQEGVETIVYAPDGVLRIFPISALWDGERFLIERYNVATVLGLTLIEPGSVPSGAFQSLVAGASQTVVEGYPDIPGILEESARISRVLGSDVRVDDSFTATGAPELLRSEPYSVVHIAAHATFGAEPTDNYIALSDGRLDMPTLVAALRARAVEQDQPIDLLTLSACQTAAGTDRAPLGLAGAAYRANARAVLASLWLVSDVITPEIMEAFYKRLAEPETGRADALGSAQRWFIENYPSFNHPAFWGAFIMVGDWQ